MGMFDYIRYKEHEYQTKDTPKQFMDHYEIREDGTLWTENYKSEWIEDPDALLGGYINQYDHVWEQCVNFTGEIVFYRNLDEEYKNWEELSAYFVQGELKFVRGKIEHLEKLDDLSNNT
jgi:hypothetical protein